MVLEMAWKSPADIDEEVRRWMKAKGWEVTGAEYDRMKRVYAWYHHPDRGVSRILRISLEILEDYPAFAILEHLDRQDVARAIRDRPGAFRPSAKGVGGYA